jgi:hypothetical protein
VQVCGKAEGPFELGMANWTFRFADSRVAYLHKGPNVNAYYRDFSPTRNSRAYILKIEAPEEFRSKTQFFEKRLSVAHRRLVVGISGGFGTLPGWSGHSAVLFRSIVHSLASRSALRYW